MSGTAATGKSVTIDAHAVIAHPQAEGRLPEIKFRLDMARARVLDCIAKRLTGNPIHLIAHQRSESARLSLNKHAVRGWRVALTRFELIPQICHQLFQIALNDRGRSKVRHRFPPLDNGLVCSIQRALEFLDGFARPVRQQVANSLESEHQALKALQQRVMQLSCDSGPLIDALFQAYVKLLRDPLHTIAVRGPGEQYQKRSQYRAEPP